jgi:hypothetical protein
MTSTIKRIKPVGSDKKETGDWYVVNIKTGDVLIQDITEEHAKGVAHGNNHNHKFGGTNTEDIFFAVEKKVVCAIVHDYLTKLVNKESDAFDATESFSVKEMHAENVNAAQRILRLVRTDKANGK